MSALITNVEHALAIAAQDVVKTAKFVETSVLPVLKQAPANQSTIESITSLVDPNTANIERAGFRGPRRGHQRPGCCRHRSWRKPPQREFDAQLVADIKAIASAVKGALGVTAVPASPAK